MKVAVTAQGQDLACMVDLRFGRTKWILIFDTETGEHQARDNSLHLNAPQGAGIQTGQNVANLGVEAVITGNVGPNAFRVLNAANIKVFLAAQQTVEQAIAAFKEGRLQNVEQANVEGHWVQEPYNLPHRASRQEGADQCQALMEQVPREEAR